MSELQWYKKHNGAKSLDYLGNSVVCTIESTFFTYKGPITETLSYTGKTTEAAIRGVRQLSIERATEIYEKRICQIKHKRYTPSNVKGGHSRF